MMKTKPLTRRDFMKVVTVAGVGSAIGGHPTQTRAAAEAAAGPAKVPTRPFGKTGVNVSALALGGIFDVTTNQLLLQRALDFGVTYWDTAHGYVNGNSERGMGMFLEKRPEVRKHIFLVTKAGGWRNLRKLDASLEESLRRLKTDFIDLFCLHGLKNPEGLTPKVRDWAEKAKAAKKIRFFGFSTHANMAGCLQAAARLGGVDGIMLRYDFRIMHTDALRAAVDACEKAGIGLTAMKTQGKSSFNLESEADLKLGGHFVKRGFTEHQAKLKAVWENPRIATICSQMPSITVLTSNVAAALDKTKLTASDQTALRQYADATCSHYCAGCTEWCEEALGNQVPVGDVMRSLMYHRAYGDPNLARETLAGLTPETRARLRTLDYSPAERVCPNRLPIARLMREAADLPA